jgi:hypothetical protein
MMVEVFDVEVGVVEFVNVEVGVVEVGGGDVAAVDASAVAVRARVLARAEAGADRIGEEGRWDLSGTLALVGSEAGAC